MKQNLALTAISATALLAAQNLWALDDAAVLPKSIYRARMVGVATGSVNEKFNNEQNRISIVQPLNMSITAAQQAAGNANLKQLYTTLNTLAPGLGDSLLQTDIKTNATIQGQRMITAVEYGLTPRLTLGVIVPFVKFEARSEMQITTTTQTATIINNVVKPMGAAAAALEAGLNSFEAQKPTAAVFEQALFTSKGYEVPSGTISGSGVGDIELGGKYQFISSGRHTLAVQSGVRLPTASYRPNPAKLLDQASGDAQTDVGAQVFYDFALNSNLKLSANTRYTMQLSDNENIPVPAFGQVGLTDLTDANSFQNVKRNLGDMLETEAGIDYSFGNRAFNTYAAYLNSVKESDLYRGDGTRNEGALTAPSTVAHKAEIGVGYSTIPLYRQKRFAVPMQIKASYNSTLGGRNTAIASFTRVDLIAFF
jgi:hypothetical protein